MKGFPVAVYLDGKEKSLTQIKYIHITNIEKSPLVTFDVDGYTHSLELEKPGDWKFVYDTGFVDIFGKKIFTTSVCSQVQKTDNNLGWEYSDIDENGEPFECYLDIDSQPNPCVYDLESGDWLYAIDNEDNNLSFDFNGERRQLLIQREWYGLSKKYFNKHKVVYDTVKLI